MRHIGRHRSAVGLVMAIGAFSVQCEPLRYEVKIDLGVGFYATRLNNLDQILGKQQSTPGVWSPGTGFAALPAPVGVTAGFTAVDLNDKGEVIGTTSDYTGYPHGLFWTSLKTAPAPIAQGVPMAINAKSHIALWAFDPVNQSLNQALIWSNGKTIALANYKGAAVLPQDINDRDAVAGFAGPAVLVTQSTAQEIGVAISFMSASNPALYVNNAGNVAGNSARNFNQQTVSRAFLWTSESGAIDLGTPGIQSSLVMGLDDHNRVLGYLDRNGGTPFVWQAGIGMTELTSLIDLGDQYARMQSVADMNSRGEILEACSIRMAVPILWCSSLSLSPLFC